MLIALAMLMGGGWINSCTNEFDTIDPNKANQGLMFKTPDIFAWSGKQTLGNYTPGTRAAEGLVEEYYEGMPDFSDWCETWWPNNVPITWPAVPDGATEVSNFFDLQPDTIYELVGAGGYLLLSDIPAGVKLYITSGEWFLCGDDDVELSAENVPDIYIGEDAYVEFCGWEEQLKTIKNLNVYNYGSLRILSYEETINEGCRIYNAGDLNVVTDEPGIDIIIRQPIYSSGEVLFSGHTHLYAESYFKKLCVDGQLNLHDTPTHYGYLNADELVCENAKIDLAPDGLIVAGTIAMRDEESVISGPTEGNALASILTNDILGEPRNLENEPENKDNESVVSKENFSRLFQYVNIYVTTTIDKTQEKEKIEAYVPGGEGKTVALLSGDQFDASAYDEWVKDGNVNNLECGFGYKKLPKAIVPEEENPGNDEGDENPEEPKDPENPEGDDPTPDPNEPTGGDQETVFHNDEVEVNLSISDPHDNYSDLRAKLSIHVRKGTDVEVVLPIPTEYMIAKDDVAIVQKHKEGFMSLPENQVDHVASYTIEGPEKTWNVKLHVTLNIEDNAVIVRTEGIDQELIDYLFEQNGDGINFEVWLHIQTEEVKDGEVVRRENMTPDNLQYWLNKSTIEFLDEKPSYYINAFMEGPQERDQDCTVSIIDGQLGDYRFSFEGRHLNDSEYNEIYVRNGVTPDHAHVKSE